MTSALRNLNSLHLAALKRKNLLTLSLMIEDAREENDVTKFRRSVLKG